MLLDWNVLIGLAVVSACIGIYVAYQKRRSPLEGAILGALLGPVGVLIESVLPTGNKQAKRATHKFLERENRPDFSQFGETEPGQDEILDRIRRGMGNDGGG